MRDAAYEQNWCGTALQARATQQAVSLYEVQHRRTSFPPTKTILLEAPGECGKEWGL